MSIRIETPTYQAGIVSNQSEQTAAGESFAVVLENVQKQKEVTEEQANYLQQKYLSDRYLTPQDAAKMIAELDQIVELDESMVAALPTVEQAAGEKGRVWNLNAYMQYTDLFRSISVDTSDPLAKANLMETMLHHSNYSWASEWGQMGMIGETGMITQLGPGINLQSKGDRQLTEQEIAALREKYMADGTLSAADARYLIGELSSMGAIDGQLAWDLIHGETFSRDFSRSRDAAIPKDDDDWALKILLDYLRDRHLMFETRANEEVDRERGEEHAHWAEQSKKLQHVLSEIAML